MRKLTIKLNNAELSALSSWLDVMCEALPEHAEGYAQMCAAAVLTNWNYTKVKPKTHFLTHNSKTSFKIDASVAMALAAAIYASNPAPQSYAGNLLIKIHSLIDQTFQ